MNSSYLKYFFSRYYTLLFDISSSTFCIYCKCFIQKTSLFNHFLCLLAWGVPLGKRFKQSAKKLSQGQLQNQAFSCRGKHWDRSKKTLNFRAPQKRPKNDTWTPTGATGCSKGSILNVFLIPFWGPVPTVKTVFPCRREPHLRGSRVSQNSPFS